MNSLTYHIDSSNNFIIITSDFTDWVMIKWKWSCWWKVVIYKNVVWETDSTEGATGLIGYYTYKLVYYILYASFSHCG